MSHVMSVTLHAGGKGAAVPVSREHEGRLFAGHKSFEWLKSVFDAVISVQKSLAPNSYLWELIYPKDKDGTPMKSANGKYRVKLFIMVRLRIGIGHWVKRQGGLACGFKVVGGVQAIDPALLFAPPACSCITG